MRLGQIRDFLAVVESGSISATARRLGVSQPGLTRSLGSLEAEVGVALLKRTRTGVALTRESQACHVRARAGYSELMNAQEEVTRGSLPAGLVGSAADRYRSHDPARRLSGDLTPQRPWRGERTAIESDGQHQEKST
ncbi:MAG: hypothetical protein RL375_2020 [Pseudomonadota bacterium]